MENIKVYCATKNIILDGQHNIILNYLNKCRLLYFSRVTEAAEDGLKLRALIYVNRFYDKAFTCTTFWMKPVVLG
jgi:hypothetical protein